LVGGWLVVSLKNSSAALPPAFDTQESELIGVFDDVEPSLTPHDRDGHPSSKGASAKVCDIAETCGSRIKLGQQLRQLVQ